MNFFPPKNASFLRISDGIAKGITEENAWDKKCCLFNFPQRQSNQFLPINHSLAHQWRWFSLFQEINDSYFTVGRRVA